MGETILPILTVLTADWRLAPGLMSEWEAPDWVCRETSHTFFYFSPPGFWTRSYERQGFLVRPMYTVSVHGRVDLPHPSDWNPLLHSESERDREIAAQSDLLSFWQVFSDWLLVGVGDIGKNSVWPTDVNRAHLWPEPFHCTVMDGVYFISSKP